jgi:hypothetical protein
MQQQMPHVSRHNRLLARASGVQLGVLMHTLALDYFITMSAHDVIKIEVGESWDIKRGQIRDYCFPFIGISLSFQSRSRSIVLQHLYLFKPI